jgi:hypothetical protein
MKSDLTIYQKLEKHNAKTFGSHERMYARLARFEAFSKKEHRAHRKIARKQRRIIERAWRERQKWEPDEFAPEEEDPIHILEEDDPMDYLTVLFILSYLVFVVCMLVVSASPV